MLAHYCFVTKEPASILAERLSHHGTNRVWKNQVNFLGQGCRALSNLKWLSSSRFYGVTDALGSRPAKEFTHTKSCLMDRALCNPIPQIFMLSARPGTIYILPHPRRPNKLKPLWGIIGKFKNKCGITAASLGQLVMLLAPHRSLLGTCLEVNLATALPVTIPSLLSTRPLLTRIRPDWQLRLLADLDPSTLCGILSRRCS